jgi:hypothetical protein
LAKTSGETERSQDSQYEAMANVCLAFLSNMETAPHLVVISEETPTMAIDTVAARNDVTAVRTWRDARRGKSRFLGMGATEERGETADCGQGR